LKILAIDKQLGIATFASTTKGIGGKIKQIPEDFVVKEVLVDGSKAELEPEILSQVEGDGRYLICLLIKRNWDTLLAVRKIAKQLGISERRVRIAGIKDKKAVTTQHISIENIRLKHLKRIQVDDLHVYPLHYSPNMIFPHMSFGNMFHLTIRNISHGASVIQERVSKTVNELQTLRGVPNFFGHQRFGTIRPITHLVGKALARNNLKKAALLFLAKPSPYEHPQSREARHRLMQNRDFEEALNHFPRKLLYERLMLYHLAKHPKDYVGAFRRLPERLRSLFPQAYQSYLFNRFLSQRLRHEIPINEPQIGDYVVKSDSHGLPTKSYIKAHPKNLALLGKAVKKGDMYVAIPLIGFKQGSSGGMQGEIEQSILEDEKVIQTNFYISPMPEMSATGELRSALTPIINLKVEKPAKDESNQHRKQLRVSFALHRGCYATIVLREFMKPPNLIKAGF